ncbi:MAG TPA: archease [Nitrospira sp.]|nr:archease [Nitrospira sp.]
MSHAFRFLDDIAIADIAFEAEGDSAEEVFVGATRALLEVLANPMTIADSWKRQVLKTEGTLDDLLIEWLSEIVYWKDAAGVVFRDAPLTLRCENSGWTIKATLIGAPVDGGRQELRNDVKGITKHRYRMERNGSMWKVTVVVDV